MKSVLATLRHPVSGARGVAINGSKRPRKAKGVSLPKGAHVVLVAIRRGWGTVAADLNPSTVVRVEVPGQSLAF